MAEPRAWRTSYSDTRRGGGLAPLGRAELSYIGCGKSERREASVRWRLDLPTPLCVRMRYPGALPFSALSEFSSRRNYSVDSRWRRTAIPAVRSKEALYYEIQARE